MELTRKQVIEELKAILEMQYWNVPLSKTALEYAINSLKADEAYQIMYEGGEIFTKADVVAMLTELQLEIEEYKRDLSNKDITKDHEDFDHNNLIEVISGNIQQKINSLKEVKDDRD